MGETCHYEARFRIISRIDGRLTTSWLTMHLGEKGSQWSGRTPAWPKGDVPILCRPSAPGLNEQLIDEQRCRIGEVVGDGPHMLKVLPLT